ncbi:hypothetical protein PRIPAC_83098, partial [Pristionchus pacificus]
GPIRRMATRSGAQAPNATELRLAARRAIAALRKAPRATAERALAAGENDENEENKPALEQLALYHLRQIAMELEDEVRSYLSTGRVRPSGVASFLLPEGKDDGGKRKEALEELMEMERVAATQRSGALRALEQQPQPRLPRPRASVGADPRLNETFVVGEEGAPAALDIPRIANFDGIREYSEKVSARDNRPPFPAAAGKRVIIVEEEDMGNPWATADGEEEVVRISGRDEEAMDDDQVARVVKELRAELVADRSFVATFRSGDMASTAREIERRLMQRRGEGSSFDIEPSRAEAEGEEEDARRDQRSKDQRSATRSAPKQHSMLPLLESTPLKARRQGMSQSHADSGSARRRILEEPPELVTIGVGTSARDAPGGYGSQARPHHQLHSTGVQCELEDPSTMSSSHSPGVVPTLSSDESTSFGQVPERLLRQLQQLQPKAAPRAAFREPTMPSSVSSPDTLMLQLLQAAEPTPPTAAPRTTAPRADARFRAPDSIVSSSSAEDVRVPRAARSDDAPSPDSLERWLKEQREAEPRAAPPPPPPRHSRMYPSSSEEQYREDDEADNTLENLDSIREE